MNTLLFLADAAAPAAAKAQGPSALGMWIPMILIFGLFYFMMIRPQQRKEKERRKMIEQLRAGAKVVFAGGIHGKIAEANERTFTIEIESGATMVVDRGSVIAAEADPLQPAK